MEEFPKKKISIWDSLIFSMHSRSSCSPPAWNSASLCDILHYYVIFSCSISSSADIEVFVCCLRNGWSSKFITWILSHSPGCPPALSSGSSGSSGSSACCRIQKMSHQGLYGSLLAAWWHRYNVASRLVFISMNFPLNIKKWNLPLFRSSPPRLRWRRNENDSSLREKTRQTLTAKPRHSSVGWPANLCNHTDCRLLWVWTLRKFAERKV